MTTTVYYHSQSHRNLLQNSAYPVGFGNIAVGTLSEDISAKHAIPLGTLLRQPAI